MGNSEAKLKEIKRLERKDEQEAQLRRLAEENHLKIKEEEIQMFLTKNLQDFDIKKYELQIRSREVDNEHEANIKKINSEHEENTIHETNRHTEEMEKIKSDEEKKRMEIERLREKDKKDAENTKIKNQAELEEIKNKGEQSLKVLEIKLEECKGAHQIQMEEIKNNHLENIKRRDCETKEFEIKENNGKEERKDERQKKHELDIMNMKNQHELDILEMKLRLQQNSGMNFNPYYQSMMPNNPNFYNNCFPMNNQMNYNKVVFEDGTPGPLPGQNMNMNQMPFPPQYMNCYNMQFPQNMPNFNNMANYNQYNNCYPNQTYVNNIPSNYCMNPNINKDMNSYSLLNPNVPKQMNIK